METPRRSLTRSILHTLATIVAAQGAQIVSGIATARAFGPAGKGVLSFAAIFVTFAVASADGLRNAIAFQVGNEGVAARTVWVTARRMLGATALLGVALFAILYLRDHSAIAYLYAALVFPFAVYLQTVNVVYLIRHAIERINVQNTWTVGAGSSLAIVVAIVVFHADLIAVLAISLFGYVVAAAWAASGVPGLLAQPEDARTAPPLSLAREQRAFTLKGGLSAIVTLLALRVDILIIAATSSKAQLGIYATAVALAELLLTLSRSITWATTGRVSTETRERSIALTARVVRTIVATQALAAVAFAIAGPWAIALAYGSRFAAAGPILLLVLPRVVFYSADGVLAYFIAVRQGRPGIQFAFELATLVACAAATYAALRAGGLHAAAAAATLSFIVAFAGKLTYFIHISGAGARAVLVPRADDVPARMRSFFTRA